MKILRLLLTFALLAGLSVTSAAPSGAAEPTTIHMKNSAFDPPRVEVPAVAGAPTEFTVPNEDQVTHTITADDKSFDSGNVNPGTTFTLRVTGTGTIKYHCEIHGAAGGVGMSGTIVILEPMTRLAGPDRIATTVAASQSAFPNDGAGAAVLARADSFPDALAGTPLAAVKQGPLMLTPSDELDTRVSAELRRALPDGARVYLLGGRSALTDGVAEAVTALGFQVVRLEGQTRYSTAVTICRDGIKQQTLAVVEVTGLDFPDALAAGAGASAIGACILLTEGPKQAAETAAYLEGKASQRWAVGGAAASADPAATKVVGSDRYDTSVKVAGEFFSSPAAIGVATGQTFADGLGGGAHAARVHGPLLLVAQNGIHIAVRDYIASKAASINQGFAYGGTSAINDGVLLCVQRSISGATCT